MVTKGLITAIDFTGNTCTVRIPFFESAGNDKIFGTAIISNTPGSYNGYKVGDAVLLAFEDGRMDNPVVMGKLYLGAAAEKNDPRGVLNVENSTVTQSATIPADTALGGETDADVANTVTPFNSLKSIAGKLSSVDVSLGQTNRFIHNQFKSVIDDYDGHSSIIDQHSDQIKAKVDKEHDGAVTGLGWNLTDEKWTIDATNSEWSASKLTLFEVDKDGNVTINGNVKIGGYPTSRTNFYKVVDADVTPEQIQEDTPTAELAELGWSEWYAWEDGKHVWLSVQSISYEYEDERSEWKEKIRYTAPVDVTGAAGESAVSYWLKISTPIHTGVNQEDDITATAYFKIGESGQDTEDNTAVLKYSWDGTTWEDVPANHIIPKDTPSNRYKDADLLIRAWHGSIIYEAETITYSPLNTPILDLSNDTDSIAYDGNAKLGNSVTSTAKVYLNGEVVTGCTFEWTASNCTISVENQQTVTVSAIADGHTDGTATCKVWNVPGYDTITADSPLIKVFTVTKQFKGEPAVSYWLKISTPIHTGVNQSDDITATAYLKTGESGDDAEDTTAVLEYSWDGANWHSIPEDTHIIPKNTQSGKYNDADLLIRAKHGDAVYETETVTYSPLNTPVLDLSNDTDAIAYDGNAKLGADVTSTATVYLNGEAVPNCTFKWTASDCTISGGSTQTVTVNGIANDRSGGTATCDVWNIPGYGTITEANPLRKVFTVAKQFKGEHGDSGLSITNNKQWYILWSANATNNPTKPTDNTEPTEPTTPSTVEAWMSTPPEAVNDYVVWTCYGCIFSDDNPSGARHIKYSEPVKDNAYALAQGKTTNYYNDTDPSTAYSVKKGDCWFDTSAGEGDATLKQWDGNAWQDIGGELVANKVTATFINALDITANKIKVIDPDATAPDNVIFNADGETHEVSIAGFDVSKDTIINGTLGDPNSVMMSTGSVNDPDSPTPSIGDSAEGLDGWVFTAGRNFGVRLAGSTNPAETKSELYANKGKIAKFEIGNNRRRIVKPGGGRTWVGGPFIRFFGDDGDKEIGDPETVLVSPEYEYEFITNRAEHEADPDIPLNILGGEKKKWAFAAGSKFGVTTDGDVYATNLTASGNITTNSLAVYDAYYDPDDPDDWLLFKADGDNNTVQIANFGVTTDKIISGTLGQAGSVMMSTGSTDRASIAGSDNKPGWTFASGNNFGVDTSGNLYARDAHVTGVINATSGFIGDASANNGLQLGSDGLYAKSNGVDVYSVTANGIAYSNANSSLVFNNIGLFTESAISTTTAYLSDSLRETGFKFNSSTTESSSTVYDLKITMRPTVWCDKTSLVHHRYNMRPVFHFQLLNVNGEVLNKPTVSFAVSIKVSLGHQNRGFVTYTEDTTLDFRAQGTDTEHGEMNFLEHIFANTLNTVHVDANEEDIVKYEITFKQTTNIQYKKSHSQGNDYTGQATWGNDSGSFVWSSFILKDIYGNNIINFNPSAYTDAERAAEQSYVEIARMGVKKINRATTLYSLSNILPTESHDLGSLDHRWGTLFVGNVNSTDSNSQSSDANIKYDIAAIGDGYDAVFDGLKPSTFKLKAGESKRTHIGFVAQDVKAAVEKAGLTTRDLAAYCEYEGAKEGEAKCGLRYTEFIALNTDQIQKLKARTKSLEDRISELEGKLGAK